MGSRDRSITCETCGLQRGGLNNYKCRCDEALEDIEAAFGCGMQRSLVDLTAPHGRILTIHDLR